MANMVSNDLYVRGEKDYLDHFLSLTGADQDPPKLDFSFMFDVEDLLIYPFDVLRRDHHGKVVITFETKNGPISQSDMQAISKKFPKLDFELMFFSNDNGSCGGYRFWPESEAQPAGACPDVWAAGYVGLR